jgi:hypothetical protein
MHNKIKLIKVCKYQLSMLQPTLKIIHYVKILYLNASFSTFQELNVLEVHTTKSATPQFAISWGNIRFRL